MLQEVSSSQNSRRKETPQSVIGDRQSSPESADQEISGLIDSSSYRRSHLKTQQVNKQNTCHGSVVVLASLTLLCLLITLVVTWQLHSTVTEKSQEIQELKSSNRRMMVELQQLKNILKPEPETEEKTHGKGQVQISEQKAQKDKQSMGQLDKRLRSTEQLVNVLVNKMFQDKDLDVSTQSKDKTAMEASEVTHILERIGSLQKLRSSGTDNYLKRKIYMKDGEMRSILEHVGTNHPVSHICRRPLFETSRYRVRLLSMSSINFAWGVATSAHLEGAISSQGFLFYSLFRHYAGIQGVYSVQLDENVGSSNSTLHLNYDPTLYTAGWQIDGKKMHETQIPEDWRKEAIYFVVYFESHGDKVEIVKE